MAIELFTNIDAQVKEDAAFAWNAATLMSDGTTAAEFLLNSINNCEHKYGVESADFMRFYFNLKMEELKDNDTASNHPKWQIWRREGSDR